MNQKHSTGSCPVGEVLGHSTRVTTFQDGNQHNYPDGSAFCPGCGTVYPSITGHPAVTATLQSLSRIAVRNGVSEPPRCSAWQSGYYQRLDKHTAWAHMNACFQNFHPHDVDSYLAPSPTLKSNQFNGKTFNPRLLPAAQELLKIGFQVTSIGTDLQPGNQIVLDRYQNPKSNLVIIRVALNI